MVCKKNTCDLYWFGSRNALRPVREESSVLSCTEVLVVGVTSECERGRGSQVLRCEWNACVTLPEPSQGPEESCACVLSREAFSFFLSLIHRLERSLHAPFIVSRRCKVTRCWYAGDPCWRSSPEASGGPYSMATCLALWRHGVGTFGTATTWPGMRATAEGVVSVFRYYSDVPRHTWSCSRRGVFVLVVCVTEPTNYTKLSRKIIHRSRRFSKLKPV
jgi:hypothetical protein